MPSTVPAHAAASRFRASSPARISSLGLFHGNAQRRQDVPPLPAHVQRGLCRNVGRLRQRARGFLQRSGQRVRRGLPREGAAQRRRKRPVAGREVLRLPRL